jgi:pimeloyl-ACP methyl ester carboxylesterase
MSMQMNAMKSRYLETVSSQYLALESSLVHYVRMGSGHPLVLVHGGGMWLYSFRHNIPNLSRHFSVFALDMPGYGYSVPFGRGRLSGLEETSRTLLGFIDRLGLGRVSLLGHSWGGGWVLHFASHHPDRVDRLILIDSSGFDVPDVLEWELLKLPFIGPLLLKCVTPGGVRKRIERSFYDRERVTAEMAREVYIPLKLEHNRKAQARIARGLHWRETERAIPRITQPCLVIWGENDRYLDVGLCARFQQELADVRSHIFRECGHSPHEELPDEVNGLIIRFLTGSGSRG